MLRRIPFTLAATAVALGSVVWAGWAAIGRAPKIAAQRVGPDLNASVDIRNVPDSADSLGRAAAVLDTGHLRLNCGPTIFMVAFKTDERRASCSSHDEERYVAM